MAVQRSIGRLLGPVWIPAAVALVQSSFRWRIEGLNETRREFRRLRAESSAPLLVCGNHLTMVDSFTIALALGSPWWYVTHFASLPWNTPERENFASNWWKRALVYVMKCIPVARGGDRREIGRVLAKMTHLLGRGEVALIFPEGGRSRTGRVDSEATTYGAGRIVKALPGCRVLCVYLRGEQQETWSNLPRRGERIRVQTQLLEPQTELRGLRGSLDVTRQILSCLAEMEVKHFEAS